MEFLDPDVLRRQHDGMRRRTLTVLWCPSDGAISRTALHVPGPLRLRRRSAADDLQQLCGCLGTWTYFPIGTAVDQSQLSLMNGMFQYIGMPAGINPVSIYGTSYPNSGSVPPVKIASITDGLSNTIAFSEHAHGLFSTTGTTNQNGQTITDFYCWNWWVSANYGDTVFTTLLSDQSAAQDRRSATATTIKATTWCCRRRASIPAGPTSASRMGRSASSKTRSNRGN